MRPQSLDPLLIVLAFLGFVSLGLPDGLLGVVWPSMQAFFNVLLDALGGLLVTFTTSCLLASFSSGYLLSRMSVGALLALSCLATATGLLGYALTTQWWIMVVLGALCGLGASAIDAGVNTYVATQYSARMINWLHACYGSGATSGPVLMTRVLATHRPWQWGYAIVGVGQLLLAVCFGLTRTRWPAACATQDTSVLASICTSSHRTLRLPAMWLSLAVFFIYTDIEAAAGTWSYSLFTEARAVPASTAGMWVSMYWGNLTVGHLIVGAVVNFVTVSLLLRLCMLSLVLGAALIWLNVASTLSFLGLAVIGLTLAPIFPSLIATTLGRPGAAHTANGIGFQIAAAVLGQALLQGLIGVLPRRCGLGVIGPKLLPPRCCCSCSMRL